MKMQGKKMRYLTEFGLLLSVVLVVVAPWLRGSALSTLAGAT